MLSSTVGALNNNKITLAVTMIVVNLGSRYALSDITPAHERLLSHIFFKRFVIFCMFFVATRDVVVSIILTAAFLFVFNVLLSESSEYCILPYSLRSNTTTGIVPTTTAPILSSPSPSPVAFQQNNMAMTREAQAQWLRDRAAERDLKENMTASYIEDEPTADHVAWAQEILRRNGQQAAFRPHEHIVDDRRSPPDGNADVVPYHTDNSVAIVGDIGEDAGLSLEEKLQRRMAERDAAFVGVAGSPPPPAPLPSRRKKQEEGEGMKEESPSQQPYAAADPVPYSGGGCLYEDADNDCDITRSTTLSYVHFDEGDGGSTAVSS